MTSSKTTQKHQSPQDALKEIRRRNAAGKPLNSGANRGDWIYAAACRFFGSWGAAIEAAGIKYGDVKMAALTKDELLHRIQRLAVAGKPLRAGHHRLESSAARRHFGTWKAALDASGCDVPTFYKWTRGTVVEQILDDRRKGLQVNALAVIGRQQGLYQAGRRRFGSWGAALAAADAALTKDKRRKPHAAPSRKRS